MDKKNEIINVAKELFTSLGFAKTTMTDIANRLDASKALLYYYFEDKESIFRALAEKEQMQFVEEMSKIIYETTDVKSNLFEYTKRRLELLQNLITLNSLNYENYIAIKPVFRSIFGEFKMKELELVKQIINKGILADKFKAINIDDHAELFIDILKGLRKVTFSKSSNQQIRIIATQEYVLLSKQSAMFTEMFLNSISN